jgi:hypothetical protein
MKIGDRFGKLVVIGEPYRKKYAKGNQSGLFVKCRCDCGVEKEFNVQHLKTKHTKSCGCDRVVNSRMKIGDRFGKLVVIEAPYRKLFKGGQQRVSVVKCRCDCGNVKELRTAHLQHAKGTKGCGCGKKLAYGESSLNELFYSYKTNAKSRKHLFDLTKEEFKKLTKQNCYYCGMEPRQVSKRNNKHRAHNGNYIYNGIDRLDNSKGYTVENSVPCCKMCNLFKNKYTKQEFLAHIQQIHAHQQLLHLQN